ncbi:MAG: FtsX-like permease family protein [Syntrophobacterales bacterium]|nr:MAG: FtsX-like permease family protein [Syntrophobacterales bacterium]
MASLEESPVAAIRMVSPGHLRAMGTPLTGGRWPTDGEALDAVLVNETFAQKLAGDGDPMGKRIGGSFLTGRIVGVVADFKHSQLDADPRPEIYYPYQLSPRMRSIRAVVRTAEPSAVAASIRELVSGIDRTQPIYQFGTLEEMLSDSIAPRGFNLTLLGSFSITAVLIALAGVYGLMAYTVELRTREVGIRMALGATRQEVVRMIVRQGMGIALAGTIAGLAGALALTGLMESLLCGVEANDPITFAAVAIALPATALLACWGPAVRAARVDPVTALRHE